jgi:CRISPR-associated protein Csd1
MIKELADFGKRVRTGHDALKDEPVSIDLIIDKKGTFVSFSVIEKIFRPAEAITAKKGKARLLLDKAEEVLCYGGENSEKKHKLFIDKLTEYKELEILNPVFAFYTSNRSDGVCKALMEFEKQVSEKERGGNIAFRVDGMRIHEQTEVYDSIIDHFNRNLSKHLLEKNIICSVCGKNNFPVLDQPHGLIKPIPGGQTSGCALISYNEKAYESYGLAGNYNSSVCTNCAKNYVEGFNYLLNNGFIKGVSRHTNRRNLGSDTAVVFWTRDPEKIEELDWLDKPDEGRVANLIDSVANAKYKTSKNIKNNLFYSLTFSGAAARIAVRDWIELSLDEYKKNIAKWFEDVRITFYDPESEDLKMFYPSLYQLTSAVGRKEAKDDPNISRSGRHLWNSALKNESPPIWILPLVLKRISYNESTADGRSVNTFTSSRASLIRLILNRNNYGGTKMKEDLDLENSTPAYLVGRLFAQIEGVQRSALGKNLNAGIRERFFSAASTNPSAAFGRLMKLTQNHLSKIRQEKPGLAVVLDTEITDLCSRINGFPSILTLEQQGQFALGYYHQKHYNFSKTKNNTEFESLTENMED